MDPLEQPKQKTDYTKVVKDVEKQNFHTFFIRMYIGTKFSPVSTHAEDLRKHNYSNPGCIYFLKKCVPVYTDTCKRLFIVP